MARVVRDPKVLLGKPVIEGTRISVARILEELASGRPEEELLADWPMLTPDDIRAALACAARQIQLGVDDAA